MKIVVLDGFTLNPGDLDWDSLKALGTCQIFDRTHAAEVVSRATDTTIVFTNKTELGRAHFPQLPSLKYIGVLATGTNVVDLAAARKHGILVANIPAYATPSVAQLTFALLLELTFHVGHHSESARRGAWSRSPDFCYWERPLIELAGLTMGIIGFGNTGRAVARAALAFDMKVLVHTTHPPQPAPHGIQFAALESIFRHSDVVSLHCPLTEQTRNLVNAERLGWMKPTAFLLNAGRGPLVDENALAAALNEGRLAGAGVDVLSAEPPPPDHPLLRASNCIITPHIAWATRAARVRLMRVAVENVRAFLRGQPKNVVN